MHSACVNWSAGISYPYSRACPLIGSFLPGFTYCDGKERESDRNIIFRSSFIGTFFLGFHIVTTGNVYLCLTMIQKRKNIKTLGSLINTQTNQIASCFDALTITLLYCEIRYLFWRHYWLILYLAFKPNSIVVVINRSYHYDIMGGLSSPIITFWIFIAN
jgi:hypothetical protein